MAHSNSLCFFNCVSYTLRKLQMTNITIKAEQHYSTIRAIYELCIIDSNLIMHMRNAVCTRPSLPMPEYKASTVKTAFTISVVRDRLFFMTEIPCMDDSVQKSLCGERLPAKHDQ